MKTLRELWTNIMDWLDPAYMAEFQGTEEETDYAGGQCFYDVKTGKHECE